jgi:hypothetical protein
MTRDRWIYNRQHWKQLRQFAFARAKGCCEECRNPLVKGEWHLHHLTYAHRGEEWTTDVLALCLICHGRKHPRHKFRASKPKRTKARPRPSHDTEWDQLNGAFLKQIEMVRSAPAIPPNTKRRFTDGKKYG